MPFTRKSRRALLALLLAAPVAFAGSAGPIRSPQITLDTGGSFTAAEGLSVPTPAHSNNKYLIAQAPDDPMLSRQNYLKQIHAQEAWDIQTAGDAVTIAVVDTGVDLNHPDLQPSLVPGVNLIQPNKPPQDDNGHGTNVAGVIAAAANNGKGVSGLLWKAKIMPVKAMEADGTGTEDKLGQGIRYAVNHGAKIIVLSLGLNKPSDYLRSIIEDAENRGVLLISAAGNEGAAVKYPAAYPTVLAVGGAKPDNQADPRANFGPELDLVAPWEVFTTALGGRYDYKDGTSMAAPQAAAVSALVWSKYPGMKPTDIRSLLRQSAEDVGPAGWDSRTGFGLLRADRALQDAYRKDPFEPNNRSAEAKSVPLGKRIDAVFDGSEDQDMYILDAPYQGSVKLKASADLPGTEINVYTGKNPELADKMPGSAAQGITIPVVKGKNVIMLKPVRLQDKPVPYHFTADFQIYADPFEDNNRQYKAYALGDRSQSVTGTFSQAGDQDWYEMNIKQPGTLSLKLSTDTPRIDPVLLVQREGEAEVPYDRQGEGSSESSGTLSVEPGTYYFRTGHAADFNAPITGEYNLQIEYATKDADPSEPNDKAYQAIHMVPGTAYRGLLGSPEDADWFGFKLDKAQTVELALAHLPPDASIMATLYDETLQPLDRVQPAKGRDTMKLRSALEPGNYYVKLDGGPNIASLVYELSVNTDN